MVELSDITLNQCYGNYVNVSELMREEGHIGNWMLNSTVVVNNDMMCATYSLNFYSNGQVRIIYTDHPLDINLPDNDIRELSMWCRKNGWNGLYITDQLAEDPRSFQFWMRQYIAGNIEGELFEKYEKDQKEKISKEINMENDTEDENANSTTIEENTVLLHKPRRR